MFRFQVQERIGNKTFPDFMYSFEEKHQHLTQMSDFYQRTRYIFIIGDRIVYKLCDRHNFDIQTPTKFWPFGFLNNN